MTKAEFRELIQHVCARWDSISRKFAADAGRPPGDKSPTLLAAWWEVLQPVSLADALEVCRRIFADRIRRPFDSDFPGTIATESRRLRVGPERPAILVHGEQWRAECKADRQRMDEYEERHGATIDSASADELRAIALAAGLDHFNTNRLERDRRNSTFARDAVLEHLEQQTTNAGAAA